jgi:hypothetical protein
LCGRGGLGAGSGSADDVVSAGAVSSAASLTDSSKFDSYERQR